jgi:hypothetical protein
MAAWAGPREDVYERCNFWLIEELIGNDNSWCINDIHMTSAWGLINRIIWQETNLAANLQLIVHVGMLHEIACWSSKDGEIDVELQQLR